MSDLLEQLALVKVPEPPRQFDQQLHDRVNRTLLAQHLVDLALSAMPWAMLQLGRAALALVGFTLSGRFEEARWERGERREERGEGQGD